MSSKTVVNRQSLTYPGVCVCCCFCVCSEFNFVFQIKGMKLLRTGLLISFNIWLFKPSCTEYLP